MVHRGAGQEVHSEDIHQIRVLEAEGGKRGKRSGLGHVPGLSQDQRGRGGVFALDLLAVFHMISSGWELYKSHIRKDGRHNQLF